MAGGMGFDETPRKRKRPLENITEGIVYQDNGLLDKEATSATDAGSRNLKKLTQKGKSIFEWLHNLRTEIVKKFFKNQPLDEKDYRNPNWKSAVKRSTRSSLTKTGIKAAKKVLRLVQKFLDPEDSDTTREFENPHVQEEFREAFYDLREKQDLSALLGGSENPALASGWSHLIPAQVDVQEEFVPTTPATVQKTVKKFRQRFNKYTPEQQDLLKRLFDNKTGFGNKALHPQELQSKRKDAPRQYKLPSRTIDSGLLREFLHEFGVIKLNRCQGDDPSQWTLEDMYTDLFASDFLPSWQEISRGRNIAKHMAAVSAPAAPPKPKPKPKESAEDDEKEETPPDETTATGKCPMARR
jgi:DNA-binding MarR family transcriptional regulator